LLVAESILKLFDKPCPDRFAVCGKGRSLDAFAGHDVADMGWCIFTINDAVHVVPSDYFVYQDSRYEKVEPPIGCEPIRQVRDKARYDRDRSMYSDRGYLWTNGEEWIDSFAPFRRVRDIRGGLGILGEWTTGKAIVIIGEWLLRHKKTAELLIVGCDAFDDLQDTATAASLPDGMVPETDYSKSSEMLGKALDKYLPCFHTVRWYHRELQCRTTQLQPS
jgi:hypothetical protein